MKKSPKFPRRTVLKSGMATLALPLFESILAPYAYGQQNFARLLVINFPHGCGADIWAPSGAGSNYSFGNGRLDQILGPHKQDITLIQKLNRAGSNTGGAHANAAVNFLTAMPIGSKTNPSVNEISMDQYVSQKNQGQALYKSLHFGPSKYINGNPVDAGNPTVYNCNLSWETKTKPAQSYIDPTLAFNQIFAGSSGGGSGSGPNPLLLQKRSVLDYLIDQTTKLKLKLSQADQLKLDEYYSAIRNIEKQNEARIAASIGNGGSGGTCPANAPIPNGRFAHEIHTNQILDMIPLIFSCDLTRVITYQIDYEFGGKDFSGLFPTLGSDGKHHSLSHTPDNVNGNITNSSLKLNMIGEWHAERLARILVALKATSDPMGGTLLDNTLVVFGSGMYARFAGHRASDIPFMLAGKGGGQFSPGKIVNANNRTHDEVLRTILERFGHNLNTLNFAQGTKTFAGL